MGNSIKSLTYHSGIAQWPQVLEDRCSLPSLFTDAGS